MLVNIVMILWVPLKKTGFLDQLNNYQLSKEDPAPWSLS
jgi:hypothetical protein